MRSACILVTRDPMRGTALTCLLHEAWVVDGADGRMTDDGDEYELPMVLLATDGGTDDADYSQYCL